MTKEASSWKRNYHKARSTLALAATADGNLFKQALVLKKESAYTLKYRNDLEMLLLNSPNGWMNETLTISRLKQILVQKEFLNPP